MLGCFDDWFVLIVLVFWLSLLGFAYGPLFYSVLGCWLKGLFSVAVLPLV